MVNEMKKVLLSLLLALPLTAAANTYNYLNITAGSSIQSVALKTVKRITFSNGNIIVTTADGTETTASLAALTNLTFTETATGVRDINLQPADLQVENGRIVAAGQGVLLLYNARGQVVRQQFVGSNRTELSMEALPHGIYIARLGNRSIKIAH